MKNTKKYVLTFATDGQGNDVKYRFILSLSKTIKSIESKIIPAIFDVEGIDSVNVVGRYTAEVSISRAFDAEEVLAVLEPSIESALSDIITPKLVI